MANNFLWQREDEPQNMLSYIFVFINLVYGITFTFFSDSRVVRNSPFSEYAFPEVAWGVLCLALVALFLLAVGRRIRFVGSNVGRLGVAVWGYGLALYLLAGNVFAALAIYLPQILFWVFWSIGVYRFYEREDARQ